VKWVVRYSALGWRRTIVVNAANESEAIRRGAETAKAVEGFEVTIIKAELKGAR